MQDKEITEKIIGCAYRVYNTMGFWNPSTRNAF